MVNRVNAVLLLLVAVAVSTHGQEIYADYAETSIADPFGAPVDGPLQHTAAGSTFWHTPTDTPLSPPFIDQTLVGNCTGTSAVVCTGCRRVRVCIPGVIDSSTLPEVNCPLGTYCHTLALDMGGACLATIDPLFPECRGTADIGGGIGIGTVGSLCTGLGVFPDPRDCRRFNYCTTVGSNGRPFRCPFNYVYNSQKKSCSRNTHCLKVQCRTHGRSVYVAYPQDPTYYAYCNYDRTATPPILRNILMYKCDVGSEFNKLANGCVFKCPHEGFFAKPGNSSLFYWCRTVRGNLFGYEQVCPGLGSTFNPTLAVCIPPPTTTTPLPTVPTTSSTTLSSITAPPAATLLPTSPASAADTPLQLPPWPQWPSLPVSSLL